MERAVARRGVIEKLGRGNTDVVYKAEDPASTAWSPSNSCLRTWPENAKLRCD
jgi:hypothetical protein